MRPAIEAEHLDRGNGWNLNDHIERYYQRGTESLYNVTAIVTGRYEKVELAEPRRDPWYAPPQDSEWNRTPQEMNH